MEYKVDIAGITYEMTDIKAVSIKRPLFDKLSVGNACSAELDITVWPIEAIPKMAEIIPWARKESTDEWVKQGVFYIDTREASDDTVQILAYDAMLKAEVVWEPRQSLSFPMSMRNAVNELASLIGVAVDSRTVINSAYTIDYPVNDYTQREVLSYIAAANAGNWIITQAGQLLLVPLFASMPTETHYLINEIGSAITFGGVRILV